MKKIIKLLIAACAMAACLAGFSACGDEAKEKEFSKFGISLTLTDQWTVQTDIDTYYGLTLDNSDKPIYITIHKHAELSGVTGEAQMRAKVAEHIAWRYSEMPGGGNASIGIPKMSYENGLQNENALFAYDFWYATDEAKQNNGASGMYIVMQAPDNTVWFSVTIVDYDFNEEKLLGIAKTIKTNFA